jgi:hypothetical protein
LIDRRVRSQSVEFHSFVGQEVQLTLPGEVFEQTAVTLRDGTPAVVRVVGNPARGHHRYSARLVQDAREAEGNSMPKMLVLP